MAQNTTFYIDLNGNLYEIKTAHLVIDDVLFLESFSRKSDLKRQIFGNYKNYAL